MAKLSTLIVFSVLAIFEMSNLIQSRIKKFQGYCRKPSISIVRKIPGIYRNRVKVKISAISFLYH